MFSIIAMKRVALALLLAGAVVRVPGAQSFGTPVKPKATSYCAGGLFTLRTGVARFHLSLDDDKSEAMVLLRMRLIDDGGTVTKSRDVWLRAGESATLELSGSGLYRAQADVFDTVIGASDRRKVVGTAELFDLDNFRALIPVVCSPPDYGTNLP